MESTMGHIEIVRQQEITNEHNKELIELLKENNRLLNELNVKSDKSLIALKKVIDKTEGL